MFEFLQFAELANIYPVICVNFDEDMAGLLEYMYGDPVATAWGRQRAADGHSRPYTTNLTIVCSNEEPQQDSDGDFRGYITAFNRWIKSTRSAATALGVWPLSVGVAMASGAGRRFSPGNEDKFTGGSTEMLNAIFAAELGDAEVVWDQHGDGGVAAGWGDENRDWATILSLPNNQSMEALSKAGGKWVKAIMLEENGGGCGMGRALGHVSNALSLQRIGESAPHSQSSHPARGKRLLFRQSLCTLSCAVTGRSRAVGPLQGTKWLDNALPESGRRGQLGCRRVITRSSTSEIKSLWLPSGMPNACWQSRTSQTSAAGSTTFTVGPQGRKTWSLRTGWQQSLTMEARWSFVWKTPTQRR